MIGRVISTKLKNTATVLVEREAKHPLYQKAFVRSKKYLVDDQIGVNMGDIVEIIQIKPISKRKTWKIVKVLGKSLAEIAEAQMKEKAEQVIAEVMPEERSENSERLRKPEDQTIRNSDTLILRHSGTPSSSESSGKKLRKGKRGGESRGSA